MNNIAVQMRLMNVYNELSSKFNFNYNGTPDIVISKRLRSSNGRCEVIFTPFGEIDHCKIVMSQALLVEFDWKRFEETFRHEVAHIANYILYKGRGHNNSFKVLCCKFGGTMNRAMAGHRFTDNASADYVKTIKKWEYSCPCGYKRQTAKRMSKKKRFNGHLYRCGKCGLYRLNMWTERKL